MREALIGFIAGLAIIEMTEVVLCKIDIRKLSREYGNFESQMQEVVSRVENLEARMNSFSSNNDQEKKTNELMRDFENAIMEIKKLNNNDTPDNKQGPRIKMTRKDDAE